MFARKTVLLKKSKQKQQNYFRERDGRTDRRTDRVRRIMRPPPKGGGPHNNESTIWPVATYGCESWTLKASDKKRIAGFEMTASIHKNVAESVGKII